LTSSFRISITFLKWKILLLKPFNFWGDYLFITFGSVNIRNSTISSNSSSGFGGGIRVLFTPTVAISNSTITNNSSPNGAGIHNSSATITVSHTIIAAQSSGSDCAGGGGISGAFNLGKDGTCNGIGFSQVPTFTLPALTNNGGPTQTHALIPGGAGAEAINVGDATCGVTTDQRGEPRPPVISGNCDIGAFELQP
jgi:hypothetical protein